MSLLDSMKKEINRTGGSKGKILFVRTDNKKRIRFLADFEKGIEVVFHDSFSKGVNSICQKEIGESCACCNDEELRTRKQFGWPVYDYDANEVRIFLYPVNNCTPIPGLISMYETYGTILDRDYVVERKGKQQSTSYTLIPMDKSKFKSSVKVPPASAIIKLIAKAYPPEDDLDKSEDDEDVEETAVDYSELSVKELYKLCLEKDLEVLPKKSKEYYISVLEDAEEEDEELEDDDEW